MHLTDTIQHWRDTLDTHNWEGTFIAVTKYQDINTTQACIDNGIQHIAETKVQNALQKKTLLTGSYTYHMIGHLQSNKVKESVACFDMIQSVDSLKLLSNINDAAHEQQKHMRILLQINLTGENQKYGFREQDVSEAISLARSCSHLTLHGLMCMGKQGDKELTKKVFIRTRKLCDIYNLPVCSMGMSGDRKTAIDTGSSMIRIGSALFSQ